MFRILRNTRRIRFVLYTVMVNLIAFPAIADQWWAAVGYRCLVDPDNFIVYPVLYDANEPLPESREGLFVQMPAPENPLALTDITSCTVGGMEYVLQRVFQNTPRPSGGYCVGANWARYQLLRNEEMVASFDIGCSHSILIVTPATISLCLGKGCEIAHSPKELPLRGYFGSISKANQ